MPFKNNLCAAVILSLISVYALAQTDGEIVIEMQGAPAKKAAYPTLSIWDKNTSQLLKMLRGKTRQQALYSIENVSSKDKTIQSAKASYALVEYRQGDEFRKFLFQSKEPQTFITAASTVEDVMAINKKYAINIGLSQKAFERAYAGQYTLEKPAQPLPANTILYALSYTDMNTPNAQMIWLLFELKQLRQVFYTEAEKAAYLQAITPAPAPQAPQTTVQKPKKTVRKALVSGGTVWDQMYMPRLVTPNENSSSSQTTN